MSAIMASKFTVLAKNNVKCSNVLGNFAKFRRGISYDSLYHSCERTSLRLKGIHSGLSKFQSIAPSVSKYYVNLRQRSTSLLHHETPTSNKILLKTWKSTTTGEQVSKPKVFLASTSPSIQCIQSKNLHFSSSSNIFKTFSTSENNVSQPEVSQEQNSGTAAASEGSNASSGEQASKLQEDISKLTSENSELKTKHDDILDKYRRSIAENDNMRKRLTKQIEDAKIFGIQGFCKDLLAVADVLEKAVEAAKAEDEKSGTSLASGIELTQNQMQQVFNRHGLSNITPVVGETKFDPNMHEALFQIPVPDKEPNIVMDVQQIGYSLHGRTIRPAKVGVSRK